MTDFTTKKCRPCEGTGKPLSAEKTSEYLTGAPGWQADPSGKMIFRAWKMKNFSAAVDFIARVRDIAESENHHPDIHLTGYRQLKIELSTHTIGGLSENDFIVAAKINELPAEVKI